MIGYLHGAIAGKTVDGCLIDVNGVGYRVACSATTLASLPEVKGRARLWIHTHVREDALLLYGFANEQEQSVFEALISVSGVGPKVALQICSAFSPDKLRKAIATDDAAALSSVPGIGKKTAARILLELKEKLAVPELSLVGLRGDTLAQARSALENLGYSSGEVRVALGQIEEVDEASVEEVVRNALKVLAS